MNSLLLQTPFLFGHNKKIKAHLLEPATVLPRLKPDFYPTLR